MAKILVVDDDLDSVAALRKFLAARGHEIDCVPNGQQALTHVLLSPPDLVILDLVMPHLDGSTLLEIMRSYLRLKSLPVIVLTGLADSLLIDRVKTLGVSAVLLKGTSKLDEIAAAVKAELHRRTG